MTVNVLVFPCGSEIGLEIHAALRHAKDIRLHGASSVSDHGEFVYARYRQIAAQATCQAAAQLLPESVCHVTTSVEPLESTRIDTTYRDRGDGFLVQTVKQVRNPNPSGEDAAWAEAMYRDFLLP